MASKHTSSPKAVAKTMSSLLGKREIDVDIKASPEKFHDMFAGKPHHISKASPKNVQGCDLHEGEWGKVGTIVFWNYVHDGKACVAKEVIEAVEPEKNLITFKVIEGDLLKEFKAFKATIQATPRQEGTGSTVRWILEYERIHEEVAHPETLIDICVELSKEIDEHLAASPPETAAKTASSLVGKREIDIDIKASPEEFHDMFAGRPHHVSKASPTNVQGCDLHEGDWGKVGTILSWNYVLDGKACVAKEVIEAVEPDKNLITFKVIEGDLMKEFKALKLTIQVNPKQGGTGSTVHWTLEYEKLHEEIAHPETLSAFLTEVSKEIDEHLASSPDQA